MIHYRWYSEQANFNKMNTFLILLKMLQKEENVAKVTFA